MPPWSVSGNTSLPGLQAVLCMRAGGIYVYGERERRKGGRERRRREGEKVLWCLLKDLSLLDQGPILMTSFNTNNLFTGHVISKYSYIVGKVLNIHIFWGGVLIQSIAAALRGTHNSIETCILSRVKQITSPGWMHETGARTWCTGKTQRDRAEREVGGGIGMGNTCKTMADSCQCMTKTTTI